MIVSKWGTLGVVKVFRAHGWGNVHKVAVSVAFWLGQLGNWLWKQVCQQVGSVVRKLSVGCVWVVVRIARSGGRRVRG